MTNTGLKLTGIDKMFAWSTPGSGYLFDIRSRLFKHTLDYSSRLESSFITKLPEGKRILDIGAGTGRIAKFVLSKHQSDLFALDPSISMLSQFVNQKDVSGKLYKLAGISLNNLPFKANSFDLVYCFGVLSNFNNWQDIIKPVSRVLRHSGKIIFNLRCQDFIKRIGSKNKGGGFWKSELHDDLTSLGLKLESQWSCPLLNAPNLLRYWNYNYNDKYAKIKTFLMKNWIENKLKLAADINLWIRIEKQFALIIPGEMTLTSIIIASHESELTNKNHDYKAIKKEQTTTCSEKKLHKILQSSLIRQGIGSNRLLPLFCVIDPLLSDIAGTQGSVLIHYYPQKEMAIKKIIREIKQVLTINYRNFILYQIKTFPMKTVKYPILIFNKINKILS